MEFDKYLMYVTIQEPTQMDINNITQIIITSYHPWYLYSINYESYGTLIFTNKDEVDDDLYEYLLQMNDDELQLDSDNSDTKVDVIISLVNNEFQQNVWNLNTAVEEPYYDQCRSPLGFVPIDHVKNTFKYTTHMESIFLCIPLQKHFNYWYPQAKSTQNH